MFDILFLKTIFQFLKIKKMFYKIVSYFLVFQTKNFKPIKYFLLLVNRKPSFLRLLKFKYYESQTIVMNIIFTID
jgi:hypothetical protein